MDAPNPSAAAKAPVHGVKDVAAFAKKKPVVTVAVVLGILVAAYLIRKKQAAQNANADAAVPELDYQGATAPIGSITPTPGSDTGYYPDPTQGAGDTGSGTIPGGTSGNVPLPPDSWGPPWWWTNPPIGGGGLPDNPIPNPAPAPAPVYVPPPVPMPAPNNGGGSPHVVSQTPQPSGQSESVPSWAGPGHKYPYKSDNGWYRVVLVSSGVHKGRWHYYGPNDSPRIKVG